MIIFMFIASLILIYFSKYIGSNFFSPVGVVSIYWCLLAIFSLVGTLSLYEWDYYGLLWIYFGILSFNVFYAIGGPVHFVTSSQINNVNLNSISRLSWAVLLFLIILGIIKWGTQVYTNGFSLTDFLSLDNLAAMNHEFAVNRYSGNDPEGGIAGIIISVLNAMVYSAPLCGGFAYSYAVTTTQKKIAIFSLIPVFLVTMTNNTKAGMIGGLLLFIDSYLIGYYCRYKKWPSIHIKFILLLFFSFGLFLSIMIFSMMLRMGDSSFSTISIVLQKIIVYAFGNIQSFDIWLSRYYWMQDYSFGAMTFLGISNVLGVVQRVQGVYTALLGTSSNVYTVFRGIVEDFGIIGGIIFISLQGFFLRIAINSIHSSYNPFISVSVAMAIFFFFLYGMIISPWTYLSFIVAFFILLVYVFIAYHHMNKNI